MREALGASGADGAFARSQVMVASTEKEKQGVDARDKREHDDREWSFC